MSDLVMEAARLMDMLPESDQNFAFEFIKKLVLAWDPDYIVLASDADYTVDDVLADQNLADCTAVVNGDVYQIPGDAEAWDSPVPSGILGAVWLSSVLHPEECPEADSMAVIDEYYETFYGFTYSEK